MDAKGDSGLLLISPEEKIYKEITIQNAKKEIITKYITIGIMNDYGTSCVKSEAAFIIAIARLIF
jgi:hypothetical protein